MQIDFSQIAVIVAFILSAFNLWDKIDSRIKASKAPTKQLEERVEKLEKQNNQYDSQFSNDLRRLNAIEEGNKVTQQALLALLNHAIDGNDIAEVKKASKDLTDYLIRR